MSKERLERLERRYRETGDVEDEGAWLRERVRCGELDEHVIVVAAYFGYPAAEAAAAQLGAGNSDCRPPAGLTREGKQAWLRFNQTPPEIEFREPEALRVLIALANARVEELLGRWGEAPWFRGFAERLLASAESAAIAGEAWVVAPEERRGLISGRTQGGWAQLAGEAVTALVDQTPPSPERVERKVVVREVVPWLLGYGDPLVARRATRSQRGASSD